MEFIDDNVIKSLRISRLASAKLASSVHLHNCIKLQNIGIQNYVLN